MSCFHVAEESLCTGWPAPKFDEMSIGELKQYLDAHHVSYVGLLEKKEFVEKAKAVAEMTSP